MVAHFNPSPQEAEAGGSLRSRLALVSVGSSRSARAHNEALSQKQKVPWSLTWGCGRGAEERLRDT